MEEKFFEVTSISKDDLESIGYNSDDVDDETMKGIASFLADNYCEHQFWDDLHYIADELKIPTRD